MAAPKILPPQNSPVFDQNASGVWAMSKPWILFFQALYSLSLQILTKVASGGLAHFAAFAPDGSLFDSGYDGSSFLKIADMPVYSATSNFITSVTGGTPNIQIKTRSLTFDNGLVTTVGAESAATDIKPKAYLDIDMALTASPTGVSAPALAAWNGTNIYAYGFSGSGPSEQLFSNCEYNHEFKEGADIYPHIHWAPSTTGAGNIKWNLDYVWDNIDSGPSAVQTISVTTAASGTAFRLAKANFPAISGTGKKIASQIQFRIWRNSADAADTYTGLGMVQTFGFHAEVDSFGSTGIYTK